jgi:isopentenyl diphosphate isomerase/L-lactate dehydrogenase-like FMN-dependent dehydrogenase
MTMANWEDARAAAQRRLPRAIFDFIDGAAFSEQTARANLVDFDAWTFEQKVLVDTGQRALDTSILGTTRALPIVLGPIGFGGLLWPRGEIHAARAAHAMGIPYCLSNFGLESLEGLRAATDGPLWFQLYVLRDRMLSETLISRAEAADVEALCITVDSQVKSVRERDTRSGFRSLTHVTPRLVLALATRPRWLWGAMRSGPLRINNLAPYPEYGSHVLEQAVNLGNLVDADLTWDQVAILRDRWKRKLVIKGILTVEDAQACASIGADAIIVSNHGGRQLDGTCSTISALPAIAAAVGGRMEILFDGGIRRGTHIVKAMALGAQAVLLGRAYCYALAAAGEGGVVRLLQLLATEMDVTIGHMGVNHPHGLRGREGRIVRL